MLSLYKLNDAIAHAVTHAISDQRLDTLHNEAQQHHRLHVFQLLARPDVSQLSRRLTLHCMFILVVYVPIPNSYANTKSHAQT